MTDMTLDLQPAEPVIDEDFDAKRREALATAGRILIREADDTSDTRLLTAGRSLIAQARGDLPEPVDDGRDFDWSDERDVVQHGCPSVAIYENARGLITIRAEREWNETDDPIIAITKENLPAVIRKLESLR